MGIRTLSDLQHHQHLTLMRLEADLTGPASMERGFQNLIRSQRGGGQSLIECKVKGTDMIEYHRPTEQYPKGYRKTYDGNVWKITPEV